MKTPVRLQSSRACMSKFLLFPCHVVRIITRMYWRAPPPRPRHEMNRGRSKTNVQSGERRRRMRRIGFEGAGPLAREGKGVSGYQTRSNQEALPRRSEGGGEFTDANHIFHDLTRFFFFSPLRFHLQSNFQFDIKHKPPSTTRCSGPPSAIPPPLAGRRSCQIRPYEMNRLIYLARSSRAVWGGRAGRAGRADRQEQKQPPAGPAACGGRPAPPPAPRPPDCGSLMMDRGGRAAKTRPTPWRRF